MPTKRRHLNLRRRGNNQNKTYYNTKSDIQLVFLMHTELRCTVNHTSDLQILLYKTKCLREFSSSTDANQREKGSSKGGATLRKHVPFIRIYPSLFLSFIRICHPGPKTPYKAALLYNSANKSASCRNSRTIERKDLLKCLNKVSHYSRANSRDYSRYTKSPTTCFATPQVPSSGSLSKLNLMSLTFRPLMSSIVDVPHS